MTLSYEDVFADFRGNVTDYKLSALNTSDENTLLTEWLHKALAKSYMQNVFSSLSLDDEIQIMTYEMSLPTTDEQDKEFVINAVAKGMVIEWLEPQVKKTSAIAQMITSSKSSNFYSQSSHMGQLRSLLEDTKRDQRMMIRDRGYIHNSYLEGES